VPVEREVYAPECAEALPIQVVPRAIQKKIQPALSILLRAGFLFVVRAIPGHGSNEAMNEKL